MTLNSVGISQAIRIRQAILLLLATVGSAMFPEKENMPTWTAYLSFTAAVGLLFGLLVA